MFGDEGDGDGDDEGTRDRRRRRKGGPGGGDEPDGGGSDGPDDDDEHSNKKKYGTGYRPFKFYGGLVFKTPLPSHGGLMEWEISFKRHVGTTHSFAPEVMLWFQECLEPMKVGDRHAKKEDVKFLQAGDTGYPHRFADVDILLGDKITQWVEETLKGKNEYTVNNFFYTIAKKLKTQETILAHKGLPQEHGREMMIAILEHYRGMESREKPYNIDDMKGIFMDMSKMKGFDGGLKDLMFRWSEMWERVDGQDKT